MNPYIEKLKQHIADNPPNFGDADSVLGREMDKIIYPVCTLCRDHERSGFVEGIKVGIRLEQELRSK